MLLTLNPPSREVSLRDTHLKRSNPQSTYTHTTFHGPSILSSTRSTISTVTLQFQLGLLKSTGRYDCFKLQWHPIYDDHRFWPVPPHLFWDSDLGKWMEGAIYFLSEQHDAGLDQAVKHIVETIRSAQSEDGYLNLHYILVEPGKRWTNIRDMHEMSVPSISGSGPSSSKYLTDIL